MIDCVCFKETGKLAECVALSPRWYRRMVKENKCGNDGCPFWKPRKEKNKNESIRIVCRNKIDWKSI